MMVLRGNPFRVNGPDDLSGRIASVTAGSSAETFAREINARFVAAKRPPMHIHSFPAMRFTAFPVVMGHAQAYFVPSLTAASTASYTRDRSRESGSIRSTTSSIS